jgi:endoglucanase
MGFTACECDIADSGVAETDAGLDAGRQCDPSFLRGINLGNRLEAAPNEGSWGPSLQPAEFGYVAKRGFDHVRLPVFFSGHAATTAPFTVDETYFQRLDWAIEQALDQCLSVVIDMHNYSELMSQPAENTERFLAIWSQIAQRYQLYSDRLAFELLNEPNGALDAPTWSALATQTVALIRTTNPTRDIIVDGVDYAATRSLSQLQLPNDAHLIASVHVYEPSLFTFQGQSWMSPEWGTTGVVFPGPPPEPIVPVAAAQNVPWVAGWFESYNTLPASTNPSGPTTIMAQFDAVSSYSQSTALRVYNGEWGAHNGGDIDSRVRWMRMVRQESERRGAGWCVWDDNTSMQLYDPMTGKWDEALVAALFD